MDRTEARPRLAAAQTVPVRGDVRANTAEHRALAREAAEAGAAVVVFPELSLTGYELDLAADLAFDEEDVRLAPLREDAADLGLTLVVGAPVRTAEGLHIGAFALGPDGALALYTKRHLAGFAPGDVADGPCPPAEPSVFVPGTRDPALRFGACTAALAICADTSHPEHPARAAAHGAALYLAGAFVVTAERERIHARLAGYARTHGMTVAMANYGGPTAGLPSAGASAIWSPEGGLLARAADAGSAVVVG